MIIQGNVKIAAVVVEPGDVSSLLEVYLHTYCQKANNELPPLNKRIG